MRFEVTILGNGSGSPTGTMHHTAHVLNVREQFFLIDCGEGTRSRMVRMGISPLKIKAVFISHIHGDHLFGLMPLISSLGLAGKQTPLKIFGPAELRKMLDFFQHDFGPPVGFELDFTPVDTTKHLRIFENRSMEVWSVPLRHRVPSSGYVFIESGNGRGGCGYAEHALADAPAAHALQLKHNFYPRSYAFMSDTHPSPRAADIVREACPAGVDLMYHESTFAEAEKRLAKNTGHSTAMQAARIAQKAGAKKLLIGHFSSRYKDLSLLENEARTIFPETFIAAEGETFSVSRIPVL
ncbi:MAG: ribonuclease Z [Alistipes sp.]|jgi:ribonuclease Z|nr:ribonuclease Z [Alistipes sp.]